MNQQFDAIYDNGVFRPLVPLSLPNHAHVKLTISDSHSKVAVITPRDEWERRLLDMAKDCGVTISDSALSSNALYE
jgi:predicted DNA-binding antitoxin AbrB/MazE fold protein